MNEYYQLAYNYNSQNYHIIYSLMHYKQKNEKNYDEVINLGKELINEIFSNTKRLSSSFLNDVS